ncbi:DUF2126 domain-containing protein [Haliangium ochraceum]|uniref:Transglutaminase-like domain-containing protein n=1 Tax=Haliangium ochraceum (strain DSM 14365 / JCM 11303 / SMP-2) TaxID=502025 RepID=D0LFZ4_HALO1|nr:transglutaminase family protein [Haliangium ochraceum]ACY14596.1 Protein of unknown function DUF2126 [Haliangium ochraceum DSM 14365]
MRIFVQHRTRYVFEQPASLGPHIVRLHPAAHTRAQVLSYNLDVDVDCQMRWQRDPWGNRVARLTFAEGCTTRTLTLTVDAAFDIHPVNPFDFFVDDRSAALPMHYPDGLDEELAPFLKPPEASPELSAFIEAQPATGGVVDYMVELNRRVAERVSYVIRDEAGIQTSEETLTIGRGSCRDSARLLVDVLRARGIAARFVSGYLVQLKDEGFIPDLPRGVDRDVVDLHAWAEAYVPGAGWIGLDGTSGLMCGEGHIPLASTVMPALAAPVSGTASQPASSLEFEMHLGRIGHEPRPRVPYTEDTWQEMCRAGDAIDAAITGSGLALTCGGEPTFTSHEHAGEPEWQTEALGASKWGQGLRLANSLAERLGTGTLTMQRMGKHYPGESLPRWVLNLLWRADGQPVWRDAALLAREPDPQAPADLALAERFLRDLAERLGVVAPQLEPGYEDPWYAIETEQRLPDDVDPLAADLDDSETRRRLSRMLGHGLGQPVGYVLPLGRRAGGWASDRWSFRREHMFLVPGDSPMGLRLPLDSLGGSAAAQFPRDVTAIRLDEPLHFPPGTPSGAGPEPASDGDSDELLYTALCVEPRDGHLCVFLPPLETADDFLALVAAVEDAAAALARPVLIEGYPPPSDPRLRTCVVAPDPGVLEVNMPVCASFAEYQSIMAMVNDAAHHAGLSTEKYQMDGREVGSGGGNHLTLGGPSTVESPFLRRPALLGGLLRYLNNHPSLSYLFTGLFVGPTSQAPRIDEARLDSLYELELALAQMPEGETDQPWLTDRLLRHLLVDVSGNGHRTEVSIDKLYHPLALGGRQGIVEFRAFEMPPHTRLAAAQMLLVRALVARLANAPYREKLVRWGSRLHDRFMLPHFLWHDFEEVAADLAGHGLPFEASWFRPFLDHRCPVFGRLQLGDVELELRTALEPWPTLGEQPSGAVVARYVDSSLERLQVSARGVVEDRHAIAVNGVVLPMWPTGNAGEQVAGVRFRAWQPPECLQPTIGVHHPLRFDVVDTWAQRSLGGCTYHVWHPGGRAFEQPPLTAFEAAARRAQRFTTDAHAAWPVSLRHLPPHPEQPLTLDLRRS